MTAVKNVLNKILLIIRDSRYRLLLFMIAVFIFSFFSYLIFYPGTKKLFLFESMDSAGRLYAESRFIPRNRTKSSVEYFCDELLLGPFAERYRSLFAQGTGICSFFRKRGGTLYIDLNEKALFQSGTSSVPETGCRLLEQNIRKNYNSVDNIVITMMGHEIYKYTD